MLIRGLLSSFSISLIVISGALDNVESSNRDSVDCANTVLNFFNRCRARRFKRDANQFISNDNNVTNEKGELYTGNPSKFPSTNKGFHFNTNIPRIVDEYFAKRKRFPLRKSLKRKSSSSYSDSTSEILGFNLNNEELNDILSSATEKKRRDAKKRKEVKMIKKLVESCCPVLDCATEYLDVLKCTE